MLPGDAFWVEGEANLVPSGDGSLHDPQDLNHRTLEEKLLSQWNTTTKLDMALSS